MENYIQKITFSSKPISIYPSYRPMYRIVQNLMVLKLNCNGNKASLLKLHLFSWGLKQESNLEMLKEYATSNFTKKIDYFSIEPSLNRALKLAEYEGLIGFDRNRYFLKEKGEIFLDEVLKDETLFFYERQILNLIAKKINENKVQKLQQNWSNATN
jgi:hypothetical protein